MKRTFTTRLTIIVILVLILATYSSEMDFMPNYKDRSDKWHLFFPMMMFYPALFITTIVILVKKEWRQQRTELLVITVLSIVGYFLLNNPKGLSQVTGYFITLVLFVISTFRLIQIQLHPHKKM